MIQQGIPLEGKECLLRILGDLYLRRAYSTGEDHEEENLRRAVEHFEKAYAIIPSPQVQEKVIRIENYLAEAEKIRTCD